MLLCRVQNFYISLLLLYATKQMLESVNAAKNKPSHTSCISIRRNQSEFRETTTKKNPRTSYYAMEGNQIHEETCKPDWYCSEEAVDIYAAQKDKLNAMLQNFGKVMEKHNATDDGAADSTRNEGERPSNCKEALNNDGRDSGVYIFRVPNTNDFFFGYCAKDVQDRESWLLIMRRQEGAVDFDVEADGYKGGFGRTTSEFWLGLERIHALTKSAPHALWIKIVDLAGERHNLVYDSFAIGGAGSAYTLMDLGAYRGDWDDPFREQVGAKFSAKDWDNDDKKSKNCAARLKGGWWFKGCVGTLTGAFTTTTGGAMQRVTTLKSDMPPIVYVHMAIRPTGVQKKKSDFTEKVKAGEDNVEVSEN